MTTSTFSQLKNAGFAAAYRTEAELLAAAAAGRFPAPRQLGGINFWNDDEVQSFYITMPVPNRGSCAPPPRQALTQQPRFFLDASGREMVEMVRPADPTYTNTPVFYVDAAIRHQWPEEYRAFQQQVAHGEVKPEKPVAILDADPCRNATVSDRQLVGSGPVQSLGFQRAVPVADSAGGLKKGW